MNLLCFLKLYINKCNLNRINIITLIILIFPFLCEADKPLISYFLDDYNYLVTIFNDKINTYDYSGQVQSSTYFDEELDMDSQKLAYMSSLSYIYNENYKIIFVIAKDLIYYGVNGDINIKLDNKNITERPSNIILHECKEEDGTKNCYFFISLIGSDNKLQIYKYNLVYGQDSYNCINYKIIDLMDSSSSISLSGSDFVTCKIMSFYGNPRYACFYENSNSEMGSIILKLDSLEHEDSKEPKFKKNSGVKYIKSVLFNSNEKAFICYINNYNNIACIIFDLNQNEFEEEYKYIGNIAEGSYFSLDYLKSKYQYILSSYSSETTFYYEIFNQDMHINDYSSYGNKYCLASISMLSCSDSDNLPSVVIFYYSDNLKMAKRCQNEQNYTFIELSTKCNELYDRETININETSSIKDESKSLLSEKPRTESESFLTELVKTESESILSELSRTESESLLSNENIDDIKNKNTDSELTRKESELLLNELVRAKSDSLLSELSRTETEALLSELTGNKSKSLLSEMPIIKSEFLLSELPSKESESLLSEISTTNITIFQTRIKKINSNKTLEQEINQLDNLVKEMNYGEVYEIKGKDFLIKISPINYNQYEESSTYIDFLDCEKTLRNRNNLKSDDNLTVVLIELNKNNDKSLTQQIEYEVFYNTKKLDLSICNNDKIVIYCDVKNLSLIDLEKVLKYSNLGIDIFNINSPFFNDICYPYNENNSDMILKDRISIIYQNYSVCDDNCDYEKFNLETLLITCKCSVKNKIETELKPLRFDYLLLGLITNSSLGVLKCYNLVFNFNKKFENFGFIIFTFLVICQIPIYIHYFVYSINSINIYILSEMKKYDYLTGIYSPIKKWSIKKSSKKNSIKYKPFEKGKEKANSSSKINIKYNQKWKLIRNVNELSIKKINIFNNSINSSKIKSFNRKRNYSKKRKSSQNLKRNIYLKEETNYYANKKDYYLIQLSANNSIDNNPPQSQKYLDNYTFEEAIKFDKRNFSKIYYICLITKESTLNLFLLNTPMELKSLRICIYIFSISCDLSLNTIFYFNDNISDKYYYNGNNIYLFTIINNVSISFISTFFSLTSIIVLQLLTNSKNEVEDLFREEEKKMREDNKYKVNIKKRKEILVKIYQINKKLKVKIFFFILIEFSIMLFFYYFVTAFCEVYKKTQVSWIIDSIISYLLSFPIQFLTSFIIAFLYKLSVENQIKWLYNLSIFFYNLG